jgi:hypothetical protein
MVPGQYFKKKKKEAYSGIMVMYSGCRFFTIPVSIGFERTSLFRSMSRPKTRFSSKPLQSKTEIRASEPIPGHCVEKKKEKRELSLSQKYHFASLKVHYLSYSNGISFLFHCY